MGSAAALYEAQSRIELIRPVDREVELGRLFQRGERNGEGLRLGAGRLRGGDTDHAQAAAHTLAQQLNEVPRGRPGAKPEPHAGLDKGKRLARRLALEILEAHRDALPRGRRAAWFGMVGPRRQAGRSAAKRKPGRSIANDRASGSSTNLRRREASRGDGRRSAMDQGDVLRTVPVTSGAGVCWALAMAPRSGGVQTTRSSKT